ncbi:MAG TPA: glycerophosphodiester phosphodiesterase family protein [Anaeromyxobacteraceae bacterium]|nr:glycerophosphodiester phosphodiesterase family protein [Anaeromyxobacteraceae bacterium]
MRPIAPSTPERPLVLAHRGASASAPENTLAAFRLAVEQGADGVELDVWRCASGEPVVIHDADARRTAGVELDVSKASLRELRQLDAGAWKGAPFRGERIPTLSEVLRELPRSVVNVELKSRGRSDARLARAVAQVIRDLGAARRVVVSSFDPTLLAAFRIAAGEIPIGALVEADPRWRSRELAARVLSPSAIHPEWPLVDAREMDRWRAAGLAVNVWTVDAPSDAARACALGVTAIITNVPEAVRAEVRRTTAR